MKKTLLFGFALGMILSGCNKDEDLNNAGTNGVSFTSYMIGSRATDTAWEPNDEIGVYMQNAGSEGYANVNVKYANSEADCNKFTSTSPITYPEGGTGTVNFMAVYPYNGDIADGNYTFTLADGDLSKNDIMYASAPSIASGVTNVNLTFQHKLSKIILQLKDEQNNTVTGATVSIDNQCVNGVLNVADGTVSVAGDATYTSVLTFAEGENGQYEVIVIPDEGREGRSIVITTKEGNTYRCPIGSIAFGNSQKYTFPVSLQAPASSGGETIINLEMGSLNIDDWDEGKTVGWIVSPDTDLTTTKTEKELATERQLAANGSVDIQPVSGMTLVATDVYCIEYSRIDASAAATLTVAPLTQRSTDTKEFSLPAGVTEGKIVFAVGAFTGGVTLSSDVDLTLDVSVYSENESEGGDTETPSEPGEIEVWNGSITLEGWETGQSINYPSDIFSQTTVDCTLRFYYSEKQEGAQINFAGSETKDATDDLGYVDIPVTETMINKLMGNEWPFLNGQNITITKIVLIQPAGM